MRAPHHTEQQHQQGFQHQWQCIFAFQGTSPRPVHQPGTQRGAQQKTDHGNQSRQYQQELPQHQVVCHGGNNAGHMRGVFRHREKAAGIRPPGNEGEAEAQVAIGARAAFIA